ncbi:MAG: 7-cyano-7-deazaguanine synthase QueC [Myxococcaceae bacterium]
MKPKAVVLLSGGLDSATCLSVAVAAGFAPVALTLDYGQRHRVELTRAAALAVSMGADHRVVSVDLRAIGGSALTTDSPVPKNRDIATAADIPSTYVPARNTIFLSLALGVAEVVGAQDIYIGVNAVDYSGYPDCRPEFIRAFENLAQWATRAGVEGKPFRVRTPLAGLSKGDIIRLAVKLGTPLAATHSCYDPSPNGLACGQCDSCKIRRKGFSDAGVSDPTQYE